MFDDLAEQYFNEKDVDKRRAILKSLVFKCESFSKEFFEKAFKKERKETAETILVFIPLKIFNCR